MSSGKLTHCNVAKEAMQGHSWRLGVGASRAAWLDDCTAISQRTSVYIVSLSITPG